MVSYWFRKWSARSEKGKLYLAQGSMSRAIAISQKAALMGRYHLIIYFPLEAKSLKRHFYWWFQQESVLRQFEKGKSENFSTV